MGKWLAGVVVLTVATMGLGYLFFEWKGVAATIVFLGWMLLIRQWILMRSALEKDEAERRSQSQRLAHRQLQAGLEESDRICQLLAFRVTDMEGTPRVPFPWGWASLALCHEAAQARMAHRSGMRSGNEALIFWGFSRVLTREETMTLRFLLHGQRTIEGPAVAGCSWVVLSVNVPAGEVVVEEIIQRHTLLAPLMVRHRKWTPGGGQLFETWLQECFGVKEES
jgi:hypothetical protein